MAPYLGNKNEMEVHDLSNQQTNCQIDEIRPEHRVPFDTLAQAHAAGFDDCHYCLDDSKR